MFDNFLGRRFTNKCKHAIKCIVIRVAAIRKRKDAMMWFLRKDVADLIAMELEVNAFGRIESLIGDKNHSSCYDILQHYCEYISIQLPTLQKQRECPQEAMEAVATLIYAAARFSDLPELHDLRRLFTKRYGSHMESLVNAEFVEKIQKKPFSMDKKLHMMQEITQEFSVTWDCKAFQKKISNSPASVRDQSKKLNNLPSSGRPNGGEHTDHHNDESSGDEKPKPVSVGRGHMKLQTISENGSNVDSDKLVSQAPTGRRDRDRDPKRPVKVGIDKHVNRTSSGQRRHESSRKTSATCDEDCGKDKERVVDQFLVNPSKKGKNNEPGMTRTRKGAPTAEIVVGGCKVVEHHTGGQVHPEAMKSVHPQRSASLPVEPISMPEVVKGHVRAVSMQPEILSPRVHPRLPDYDELVAQFRALKKA